ncbi:AAA domain-containing protein, putative AbiEii toxin, Type IV TA system [Chitinophaga costaii]|uniref:AAA domain-containing protein, putative AbiEii toxin, Type IV TA system n=1 Tax=Chitinophaga costaii TaxID=1335309 RepID=A0A1C4FB71_9BACT|nr:ATP-binding protein [Chitinophaga costaii]PUZ20721.1 ATP-binding protein [Chitinophaga costaii]SCC53104.1 AAA domain-containing protein, putative AbiEii toxin, Type IV TA system [Chitinophaga costaii]
MLLKFTTGNYCCFREKQSLSLHADGRHAAGDVRVVQAAGCNALQVVGILGDTATGKSHLGKALQFMTRAVLEGWQEAALHCSPFAAGGSGAAGPSFFEILLLGEDVRYRYGFELKDRQVQAEWLYERKGRRELRLFSRQGQALLVHATFVDARRLIGITPSNILLLTIAARLHFPLVAPLINWYRRCQVVDAAGGWPFAPGWEEQLAIPVPVMSLRRLYDELGIGYIAATMQSVIRTQALLRRHGTPPDTGVPTENTLHNTLTAGTRSLLAITPAILKVINEGGALFLDDLDAHLSLSILQGLVALFQHPELNPRHAQLIFTTHLPAWIHQGKWLNGQRYILEKPQAAASLQHWSMPARK